MLHEFKNLVTLQAYFKTEVKCFEYLEKLRFIPVASCPFCGSVKVYKFADRIRFRCGEKGCLKLFKSTTGTAFEGSKISLIKWFMAVYIATSHKKGISSCQLAKDLGITQKTAWFMLSRIRNLIGEVKPEMLSGIIEVDESVIGGSETNKHQSESAKQKRKEKKELETGKSYRVHDNKTNVLGMMQRDGLVRNFVVKKSQKTSLVHLINQNVEKGSTIYSDQAPAFHNLNKIGYSHASVPHYLHKYVYGNVHTASLDSYWSGLKRGIVGIYHQVTAKHLHRYCSEFSFRFNTREMGEVERFNNALSRAGGSRLKYAELIEVKNPF